MSDATQLPSETLTTLFIKSSDWHDVEFVISKYDNELNIEVMGEGERQTWLTVDEAKRLRDWLIRMYP